jgi:hypothetical protein
LRVIVFTSDKYIDLIKQFAYLFNKHWGKHQVVDVLGFEPPDFDLPENFNFISAGKQSDFPPKSFCQPFRPIIEKMDTEIITVMLEDAFLIDTVDQGLLQKAQDRILSGQASAVDLFLGADYQHASSTYFDDDFNVFPQDMDYRFTASQKIISKDYYLKYFDRETIWHLEVENIPRSKFDGHNLLVSRSKPIAPWLNTIVKGQFNKTQWNNMASSPTGRNFGWNIYQRLNDEEFEIFASMKDWSPRA